MCVTHCLRRGRCSGAGRRLAGGPTLFRDLNFGLDLESRFAIVGPNGIGKVSAPAERLIPRVWLAADAAAAHQRPAATCTLVPRPPRLRFLWLTRRASAHGQRALIRHVPALPQSTLLGLISGQLQPTTGHVSRNPKVRLAIFSQHHVDGMDLALSPLAAMRNAFPNVKVRTPRRVAPCSAPPRPAPPRPAPPRPALPCPALCSAPPRPPPPRPQAQGCTPRTASVHVHEGWSQLLVFGLLCVARRRPRRTTSCVGTWAALGCLRSWPRSQCTSSAEGRRTAWPLPRCGGALWRQTLDDVWRARASTTVKRERGNAHASHGVGCVRHVLGVLGGRRR